MLTLVVLLQTDSALGQIVKTAVPSQTQQPVKLKVIDKMQFCSRLKQSFAAYGKQSGYDEVQTAMLATSAPSGLIEEFKYGKATDFISTQTLASYSKLPSKGKEGYLSTAHFLSGAMGLSQDITLALSVGELRFIPFAQKGKEIVVLARSTVALSPARAKKVAEVARASGIKLNVIWVGTPKDSNQQNTPDEVKQLEWLAAITGGSFVNLSDRKDPCGFIM